MENSKKLSKIMEFETHLERERREENYTFLAFPRRIGAVDFFGLNLPSLLSRKVAPTWNNGN
jgi:hypothetical protein